MKAPEKPLDPLKRKDNDPLFDEPWQAQALAMADTLVQTGTINAPDWAKTLGAELRKAADAGAPDDAVTYYRAVISALEDLLDKSGAAKRDELDVRRDKWERAYLNTPHGLPVELSAGNKT